MIVDCYPNNLNTFHVFIVKFYTFCSIVEYKNQIKKKNKAREVFTKPRKEDVKEDEQVDANILVENEIEKSKKGTSGK